MPDKGFYGLVWRFNALAIAVAASGAIVALILMFGAIVATFVRERDFDETGLVERGAATPKNVSYSLGRAEAAEGTQVVIHTLDRTSSTPRAIPIKSAYSYDSDVVNLLVVDDATATGRWMFEGAGQALFGRTFIYDPATLDAERGQRRAIALLIEMSIADTNKDGIVDARDDERTLMVYTMSDGTRVNLLKGPHVLISMRQTVDGRVLVMYEQGTKTILASYAAVDFRLLAQNELPRLSTEAPAGAN